MSDLRIPNHRDGKRVVLEVGSYAFDAIQAGPKTGPLVLFLHGWPEFATIWSPVVEALAADGRHAVAVDQRGYSPGARPTQLADYAPDKLVEDVFAFADTLAADTFDLVAHDWGGVVAWIAAGAQPRRVRSLTVFATPHPRALAQARATDPEQQAKSAYIGLHAAPNNKAESVYLANGAVKLRAIYGKNVPAAIADENVMRLQQPGALTATLNWYRAAGIGPAAIGDAPDVWVPTLYAWGSEDIALGERAALATKEFVRGPYRFERLDGISHWIPTEIPNTVIDLVRDHLAVNSPVPSDLERNEVRGCPP